MDGREQVEFVISLGVEYTSINKGKMKRAIVDIVKGISLVCGGCTVLSGVGYWAEDGAEHKTMFTGKMHEEISYVIKVSCELEKKELAYRAFKEVIAFAKDKQLLDLEWIHCQEIPFIGRHFQV